MTAVEAWALAISIVALIFSVVVLILNIALYCKLKKRVKELEHELFNYTHGAILTWHN